MDTTEKSQRILSLCTGVRGLERGIERALEGSGQQLDTVAFVEIEAFIVANLIAGMEAGVLAPCPVWTDLKTFPYQEFHGKIHGIIGGYPCQPFSNAGNRGGEDDPRHLWPHIAKGIGAVQPLWCFFENVPGHLTLGYETVRRQLQELGYRVKEGIFSAEEVGAPHQRERLFILAILGDSSKSGLERSFGRLSKTTRYKLSSNELDNSYCNRPKPITEVFARRYSIKFSGKKLANARIYLIQERKVRRMVWRKFEPTDKKLAITNSIRYLYRKFGIVPAKGRFDAFRYVTTGCKQRLANACIQRLERSNFGRTSSKLGNGAKSYGTTTEYGQGNFPSRPGEQQHEWEEKRTIESGMGCTIDGYNFREDLLRAYGNGVVEQTAELAFITLLNEHLND